VAIPMPDRYNAAEVNEAFRQRVQARMNDNALAAYTTTALTDGRKQAKRLALAAAILAERGQANSRYVSAFAWWLVSISSYTTVDDITDQQIINNLNVTGAHDQLADQLIADTAVVVSEAQGVVAVGAAVTSVTSVAHNLGVAPTADKFWFAFAADPLAAGFPWASAITTTTFTLNVKAAPGGAGTSVAWHVRT
jgi:hypothetical protein